MKYAYITLLSSKNYLESVIALSRSLKQVGSKYPLQIAVTEDIYHDEIRDILRKEQIKSYKIPLLEYSKITQEKFPNHPVLRTASKIYLFNLNKIIHQDEQIDKFCYIDSDVYVVKNIDSILEQYPDGAMLTYSNNDRYWGHSSLFIFSPANHCYSIYKTLIENKDCFDGDLLGKMWFFTKSNPAYRIPSVMQNYPSSGNEIRIYHFCNTPKPWLVSETQRKILYGEYGFEDKVYNSYLQLLTNIELEYPIFNYLNKETV